MVVVTQERSEITSQGTTQHCCCLTASRIKHRPVHCCSAKLTHFVLFEAQQSVCDKNIVVSTDLSAKYVTNGNAFWGSVSDETEDSLKRIPWVEIQVSDVPVTNHGSI